MTPLPQPQHPVTPTIETRRQLDALVENIVLLQLDRAELEHAQEQEIAAIRQKFRPALAEIERYLTLETSWAETWARQNPGAFGDKRSLDCAHATVRFSATTPRVERASRRWTWSRIAQTLAELPWGKRYLRVPAPEVDKDAILADLEKLSPLDLRSAGLKIVHGDRFHITPRNDDMHTSTWQEAA